jgi:hypothetical protein
MTTTTLIPCPDCAGSVSEAAAYCVHCGSPLNDYVVTVLPGPRWSWTVYWGIVLVILIPMLMGTALCVLLVMVILSASAGNSP